VAAATASKSPLQITGQRWRAQKSTDRTMAEFNILAGNPDYTSKELSARHCVRIRISFA
jgi:hypothetical protein